MNRETWQSMQDIEERMHSCFEEAATLSNGYNIRNNGVHRLAIKLYDEYTKIYGDI